MLCLADEEEASARRTGSIFAPNVLEGMEEEIDEEDAALKVNSQAILQDMCVLEHGRA